MTPGNVPGTWTWVADELAIDPRDLQNLPTEARPILHAVLVCPAEAYKGALVSRACSIRPCQTGRLCLSEPCCTCPTCLSVAGASPCQTGRPRNSCSPVPCPTSKVYSLLWAGPVRPLHSPFLLRIHSPTVHVAQVPARLRADAAMYHKGSQDPRDRGELPQKTEWSAGPLRLSKKNRVENGYGIFTPRRHSEWPSVPPLMMLYATG